jgi:thiol-disulfide isomerase/thioredoxin
MFHRLPHLALTLAVILAAASFAIPLAAQDKKTDDKKPAAEKEKEFTSNEDEGFYDIPETDKVDALVAFVNRVRSYEPRSRDENTLHQRRLPISLPRAAERILQLEKDKKTPAALLASEVLLNQEVQQMLKKAFGLVNPTPSELAALYDKVKSHVDISDKSAGTFALALDMARAMEYGGARDLAVKAYGEFGTQFKSSKDKDVAKNSEMMTGAGRRLGLVGKKMELKGKTLAGKPFNIDSLKGKVVLVDFWATWCGPCLSEQKETIAPNYKKYRDKGFEVVAISIDQDRDALDQFMAANKLPWVVLHEEGNPVTTQFGIFSIPTVIFVDKDGKVVSLEARGSDLEALLEKHLGPAPTTPPTTTTGAKKSTK